MMNAFFTLVVIPVSYCAINNCSKTRNSYFVPRKRLHKKDLIFDFEIRQHKER